MMRRLLALAAIGALVGTACGSGSAAGADVRLVRSSLERTDRIGREFVYTEESGDQRVVITGKEADDLRYQGLVNINGRDVFEAIVSDDAFALRLIDPASAPQVIATAKAEDEVLGTALEEGRWVVDHTAAPPVIRERQENRPQEGADPFLDVFYVFQYLKTALVDAGGVFRYNPENLQYNPEDDPWSGETNEELEDRGLLRYDAAAAGLPSRTARGSEDALPSTEQFRKMAFYIEQQRVVEVREQIDINDRREFRRAEQGRAAQYYLELRDRALRGITQEPIRQRTMRYEVTRFGEDITVEVPPDAEAGTLGDTLGPRGLGSLFAEIPEARAPGQLPVATPAAEGGETPAATPAPGQQEAAPDEEAPAQDGDPRSSLRNTITAAKTIYTDSQDYRDATPESLEQAEPSYEYLADGESTGPGVISILAPDADTFVAAASGGGTCYAIRDNADSGTMYGQKTEGPCTASSFPADSFTDQWS